MGCGGCSKSSVVTFARKEETLAEKQNVSKGKLLCIVRNHSSKPTRFVGKSTGNPYSLRMNGEEVWVLEQDYVADRKRLVFTGEGRMHCDLMEVRDGSKFRYQCIRCGQISAPLPKRTKRFMMPCLRDGIGDRFERFLHAIGIKVKCGGCSKRKAIMNDIDRRIFRMLKGPKDATYLG